MDERSIRVRGARVRYRISGAGPPLVLVHGLSASWRWWRRVAPLLASRFTLLLVDVPRFGPRSGAGEVSDWLARWLEALELERVHLAGHSLGGLHCARLAARRPELVDGLILVSPAGVPLGHSQLGSALPLVRALLAARGGLHPLVLADGLRAGPLSLALGARHATSEDLRFELGSISARTLLIWGERDPLVPATLASEWQRCIHGSQLVVLPGVAHVPMLDAPGPFADTVLGFL